jgi:hypothetical protein
MCNFLTFFQVRGSGGPPRYVFFTTVLSKKLIFPSNIFLRKRGAKVIANKNVTRKVHKGGVYRSPKGMSIGPSVDLQGLRKGNIHFVGYRNFVSYRKALVLMLIKLWYGPVSYTHFGAYLFLVVQCEISEN